MKSTIMKDETNRVSRVALWRNHAFMLLWSGQAVSSLGTTITQTAYPLLVWDLSHSAALVGLVGGLGTLPYILLSLIVGALVDRWDRKHLMVLCDTGRTLNLASVLVMMALGRLTVVQICANTLIEGTFYVFFNLAEASCLPRVVSKEQIPLATSQNETTTGATVLVGPALGGALYTLSGFVPFLADAVSYVVSVITLSFIKVSFQEKREAQKQRKLLVEIREGLVWLWHQPLIRYIAFLTGGCNFVGAGLLPILLVLVKQQHGSSLLYGTILTIGGVGAIVGSLLGAPIQKRYRFGPVIICLIWFEAVCFPLYAIAPNPFLLGVISACLFVSGPIYNVVQFSYRITLIPDELQGRVNSVFRLLAFGFQPFGFALTGLVIQWFGVISAILFLSACALFLAILTSVNKHVIHAGA
ncbi:MFS transporter [Dictyobacter aurantiacus]|uniref:MFS transporter n=1 Tax=Dictyobacter aurantiacus TaxID=1936993 RepID=A0A401ZTB2_9CHLR|nr:MFS transporter [Dictyobacter aurantiacus]GCE10036.1 MFS transporter [Dictyobacter aurantiacus]